MSVDLGLDDVAAGHRLALAELAELRRDKARMDWVGTHIYWMRTGDISVVSAVGDYIDINMQGPAAVRAIIDDAMARLKP